MGKSAVYSFWISISIVWVAQFVAYLPSFCSWDYLHIGYLLPLIIACGSVVLLGFPFGIYFLLTRKRQDGWRRYFVHSLTGICLAWIAYLWADARPSRNFEDRVTQPIPVGITNLQARGFGTFGAHWAFQFTADRAAIETIVQQRALTLVPAADEIETLRSRKDSLIPAWVIDEAMTNQNQYYSGEIPETENHRRRRFWCVYQPLQQQAWFYYYAPM